MTQKERVKERLREQEWLSAVDMINDPIRRSIRLGAIIFNLREKGYQIEMRMNSKLGCGEYHLISEPVIQETPAGPITQLTLA